VRWSKVVSLLGMFDAGVCDWCLPFVVGFSERTDQIELIDYDVLVLNPARNRLQSLALAGACNTEPAVDQKECAMRGALNECCVAIQKLIVYPLEFDTEVRATIPINIDLMRAVHGKKADVIQTKATARGIGELVQGAQFSFQCLSLRCGARRVGWVIGGWVSTLSAT
jgi:hypothetical protein